MSLKLIVSVSFAEFVEIYLEYARAHKRTWKLDEGRCRLYLLPAWRDKNLQDITKADVVRLHNRIGRTKPYQANRVLENVSKMFNIAIQLGYLPEHYINPAKNIEAFKEKDRFRFLSRQEAERLLMAVQHEDSFVQTAILLLLMTGLRRNEILRLKWCDVNLEEAWIRIIDKNNDVVYQPLSPQAVAVLKSAKRIDGNPYVVCGAKPGQPRNTITKAWNRVKRHAEIEDVRIHDLRRTVGAWLTTADVPLQIVKEVLNHKDLKSTLIYARVPSNQKRAALDSHSALLESLLISSEKISSVGVR